MQTPDCDDDREVSARLRQLRRLVDALRSRRVRAEAGAPRCAWGVLCFVFAVGCVVL
jgi:hypothetical protein